MNFTLKDKSAGLVAALSAAVIAAITAVGCMIYYAMYSQYSDFMVIGSMIAGAVLLAAYTFSTCRIAYWSVLMGTLCVAFGLGLFIANSYNVWADANGNLTQYGQLFGDFHFFGSEGGPIFPAILIILGLSASICGIVSCFQGKEEA